MASECRLLPWPNPRRRQNPYQKILYGGLAQHGVTICRPPPSFWLIPFAPRFDWLHLNWPERIIEHADPRVRARRLERLLGVLSRIRRRGGRVLWTFHNDVPHEAAEPDEYADVNARLCRHVDLIHAHFAEAAERLTRRYGAAPDRVMVMPHPSYGDYYGSALPQAEARQALGLPQGGRVVLTFGNVRAYKGLELAVDAFSRTRDPHLRYVIAGKPNRDETVRALREARRTDPRLILELSEVPDHRVAPLFCAADAYLFPSVRYLTSGSLVLALTYGLPVMAAPVAHASTLPDTALLREWSPATPESLARRLDDLERWPDGAREDAIRMVRAKLDATVVTEGLAVRLRG